MTIHHQKKAFISQLITLGQIFWLAPAWLAFCISNTAQACATPLTQADVSRVTSNAVKKLMQQYQLAGVAVGMVVEGKSYVFNFGLASAEDQIPVTDETLFEVGSISKTFSASLASVSEVSGYLNLSKPVENYWPEVKDTPFGHLKLYHLATHTGGGFPLQVPDSVTTDTQLLSYFKNWTPEYPAGSMRTYANPSIGALGLITAKTFDQNYASALSQHLLKPLKLKHTYIKVPGSQRANYAWGYNAQDKPIRVNPGMLADEAYGVKTTAGDLLQFVKANMGLLPIKPELQTALYRTQQSYFKVGPMTQDLIWEQYQLPVKLKTLQQGNSRSMLEPIPVAAISTQDSKHKSPASDVWINKTGATNGFGAYVAFVPKDQFGVVILANKNYPNEARVALAYRLYTKLAQHRSPKA